MIPMIDLLMVTISFLLITAVWTHLQRVDATANVPGVQGPTSPEHPVARLHVEMRDPARFVLHWNEGATVIRTRDVTRLSSERSRDGTLRFPELAAALAEEDRAAGSQPAPGDGARDRQHMMVLHTSDDASYSAIVAAMDAAYSVRRPGPSGVSTPAFAVTLASN